MSRWNPRPSDWPPAPNGGLAFASLMEWLRIVLRTIGSPQAPVAPDSEAKSNV